jgi:hypothetical protein
MAHGRVPIGTLGALGRQLLGEASDALGPAMEKLSGQFAHRAASLGGAATRLEKQLGKTHPEVVALRRAATAASALGKAAGDTATGRTRAPKPSNDTWVVFGRVTRADGTPGARLKVLVTTHDESAALDRSKAVTTGADGDFSAAYQRPDLPDPPSGLAVRVEDAKGTVLVISEHRLSFLAGGADYVQVVLSARPTRQAKATKKAAKPAPKRSGTSARRSRRPSS